MTNDDEKLLASLTGYTEGPWWRDPDSNEIYGGSCNVVVAYSSGLQFKSDGPLIAAAPDLFRIATEQATKIEAQAKEISALRIERGHVNDALQDMCDKMARALGDPV